MILDAVLILGGVGLVFGVFIAIANKRLWVWEDPRIDVVVQMLPNANCGACGLPGCRAFAEQAVEGKVTPSQCTVSNDAARGQIADYLGVDAGEAVKFVARLLCAGVSRDRGLLPRCRANGALPTPSTWPRWPCCFRTGARRR